MEPVSMYGIPACSNRREISRTMSISFMPMAFSDSQPSTALELLLGGAFAKKLGDIKVHEVGVMENNRLDRALHLVALVTVRRDDVHDFTRDAVLVGQRDTAKWMPHLLPKWALNHLARHVLIEFQGLTHIRKERAGYEIIALNRNVAAEGVFQYVGDGDA